MASNDLNKQKSGLDFGTFYENLCALNNVYPLPCVKAFLHRNMLDLNADRIRTSDWLPILEALKINKNLEHIAFRSQYESMQQETNTGNMNRKPPAIRSKEITFRICRSVRECLANNAQLQSLCLDGIFIRGRDMEMITKGLYENRSLKQLSLEKTSIGDDLLEALCPSIKNMMSLVTLNLSSCQLTCKSAETLTQLIKHQGTARHNEAWHDSLRYRKPDLDRMGGLRRITINNNTMIGDEGSRVLADGLKDDLWLKALDMHNCGLTRTGGEFLLQMLKYNSTLVVVDIRGNQMIDAETINSIMDQLIINTGGQETEFKWLKVIEAVDVTPRRRRSARTGFASNKRNILHRNLLNNSGRKRTKGSNIFGLPWRTALRAEIHRSGTPERATPVYESLSDASTHLTPFKNKQQKLDGVTHDPVDHSHSDDKMELLRKLSEETRLRLEAQEQCQKLKKENEKLSQEVEELREKTELFDNDEILENIEQSFQQFHSFLDTLKNMGLGKLVSMAGLDHTTSANQFKDIKANSNQVLQHIDFNQGTHQPRLKTSKHRSRIFELPNENARKLESPNHEGNFELTNETFASSEYTQIEDPSNETNHSDNSIKMDANTSLWVRSNDTSGIYRNASALEAFNKSKKNVLDQSNLYLRETTNIAKDKYKDKYNERRDFSTKQLDSSDMHAGRYLRVAEGTRENVAPVGDHLMNKDRQMEMNEVKRSKSKFDELYERIKNRSIVNN